MLKTPDKFVQRRLDMPILRDFLNMKHELVLLAKKINWDYFEKEFAPLYSDVGRPAMPIRFSVGCLLLKHLHNLGDEKLPREWESNPYMQYFCGEQFMRHKFPCDPSDFVHFRNRIGEDGIKKIFEQTVLLHGKDAKSKLVLSDTTVQGNNITYPTDSKLAKKVLDNCNAIAKDENVKQRQSYVRVSKKLMQKSYNGSHPSRATQAKKARSKIRTLAGRQLRELRRKLPVEVLQKYKQTFDIYERAITQQRHDKDKVYSLHKAFTCCIAKGKAHAKYEYGNKVGLIVDATSLIVTAIQAYSGNPYDGKTIEPLLAQLQSTLNYTPDELCYDRGGRGPNKIGDTKIIIPSPPKKRDTSYQKQVKRKKCRRRAAIEAVISHLKQDYRMAQNYYHGERSPQINAYLAASAWNLKKLMAKLKKRFFGPNFHWLLGPNFWRALPA